MPEQTDRLKQIRERLDAATPGPWMCKPSGVRTGIASWAMVISRHPSVPSGAIARAHTDGVFIAWAPDDIRFLLGEVERLQKAIEEIRDWTGHNDCGTDFCSDRCTEHIQEAAREALRRPGAAQ